MQRFVILLFVLLVVACATSGPSSSGEIRIVRDDYGVPHIYADSVYGLFYGYGYAIAQDRLFQMEMARRSTQGKVAEVLGPEFLDFDIAARRGFSPDSIRQQIAALTSEDRDILEGYAAGINAKLKHIGQDPERLLPLQFTRFDIQPTAWSAYDVAMVFVGTMANRYGDFNTELENSALLSNLREQHGAKNASKIFDSLNPRYTRGAPTTIAKSDWPGAKQANLPEVSDALLAAASRNSGSTEKISGFSNVFVLGPEKTVDANAILVNGPQFGWFVPAYVYSVGLHGAGFDVAGNTPFGYPGLLFGHNRDIGWGSTWGAGDIVDIFAEEINPDDSSQYWYQGGYRNFEIRTELIKVRGADSHEVDLERSVHGPIVARDESAGIAFAKERSWHGKELQGLLSWVNGMKASNYAEWIEAAKQLPMNINWYFAHREGDIGYAFTGHYPERATGHDNRLPVTGRGTRDWQGVQDFSKNPQVLNPEKSYIANWNNKPGEGVLNPDEFWYSWSRADRVDFLHDAIEARGRFTADDAWNLIESSSYADVNAPYFMRGLISAAASYPDSSIALALTEALADWNLRSADDDQDGYYDGLATPLFREFLAQLNYLVLADDLGSSFPMFAATGYPEPGKPTGAGLNIQTGTKAVLEAMDGNSAYDFLNGQ
ncbi:MAG: penicillin acylase family protein [Pseudomonadota bacterium]